MSSLCQGNIIICSWGVKPSGSPTGFSNRSFVSMFLSKCFSPWQWAFPVVRPPLWPHVVCLVCFPLADQSGRRCNWHPAGEAAPQHGLHAVPLCPARRISQRTTDQAGSHAYVLTQSRVDFFDAAHVLWRWFDISCFQKCSEVRAFSWNFSEWLYVRIWMSFLLTSAYCILVRWASGRVMTFLACTFGKCPKAIFLTFTWVSESSLNVYRGYLMRWGHCDLGTVFIHSFLHLNINL